MTPAERIEARREFRVRLFVHHGIDMPQAESIAKLLTERDAQRDDRRLCLECSNLQRGSRQYGRTCFAHEKKKLGKWADPRRFTPLVDVLQRCEAFKFTTP